MFSSCIGFFNFGVDGILIDLTAWTWPFLTLIEVKKFPTKFQRSLDEEAIKTVLSLINNGNFLFGSKAHFH